MYARKVRDRVLTFGVSGKLWGDSLVMIDSETESLWSHILGEAKDGPLKGEKLEVIPSAITRWGNWKKNHPNTTVLIMDPTVDQEFVDLLFTGQSVVLGYSITGRSRAWRLTDLEIQPVVNDEIGDKSVVVFYEPQTPTAVAFSRKLDGRTLTFEERSGRIVDLETGSTWNRTTGAAVQGKLKGFRLKKLPAFLSAGRAWSSFHNKKTDSIWQPAK